MSLRFVVRPAAAIVQLANLRTLGAPLGWDGTLHQPDPLLPDNGFIDLLALDGGIGVGETRGGFAILLNRRAPAMLEGDA